MHKYRRLKRSASEWEAIVSKWKISGQPAKSWCKENNIIYSSFIEWRLKLGKEKTEVSSLLSRESFTEIQPPQPLGSGVSIECRGCRILVEKILLDIKEEDKICPVTGKPLIKIGEEITSKLCHKPGSYYIKEYIRPKYAFSKEAGLGIVIAELPDFILPKSPVDESFLANLIVQKFGDHLPCYRLCEIHSRAELQISRQQLSSWLIKTAKALRPLYDLMHVKCRMSEVSFVDESPVDQLGKKKGKAHKSYMWLWAGSTGNGGFYHVYHYRTSREHKHANELLIGYTGTLHSDNYKAYGKLAKKEKYLWCPCWAHIRRYSFEANDGDELQKWFLRQIRYLYMLERVAWARSPEERLRIRQEKETPIIDQMISVAETRMSWKKDLPRSKMRKALAHLLGLKSYLKNYTRNAYAHLGTNLVERQAKTLAIGRKNWLFVGSEEGGEAAAIHLSFVQTCRAMGINPCEYLEDVMRRINSHPFNRLEELLPDQWLKRRQASSPRQ